MQKTKAVCQQSLLITAMKLKKSSAKIAIARIKPKRCMSMRSRRSMQTKENWNHAPVSSFWQPPLPYFWQQWFVAVGGQLLYMSSSLDSRWVQRILLRSMLCYHSIHMDIARLSGLYYGAFFTNPWCFHLFVFLLIALNEYLHFNFPVECSQYSGAEEFKSKIHSGCCHRVRLQQHFRVDDSYLRKSDNWNL